MLKSILIFFTVLCTLVLSTPSSFAQFTIKEETNTTTTRVRTILLPYAFATETLGIGIGVIGSYGPKAHPETLYYGTVYATDNGSALALIGGQNIPVSNISRLYIRPYLSLSHLTQLRIYQGSNESSSSQYIEEDTRDISANLGFRYILPIGHYRDQEIHTYLTKNGILVDNPRGATSWNPLESGATSLIFEPFYRKQFVDKGQLETLYFKFGFEYDNSDFKPNPHKGFRTLASVTHDPNLLDNTRRWTTFEGEIDGYIPLWNPSWSRQQTLALSAWTAHSPSYKNAGTSTEGKPPYFAGAKLGGLWRLRGFSTDRFHDKSAIHYSAEYRVMPSWQPFNKISLLDPLQIRWWQVTLLAEAGRVAPEWRLDTLHRQMKFDAGIGLRGMFDTGIGRVDFVGSEEGFSIVAMFGQAF